LTEARASTSGAVVLAFWDCALKPAPPGTWRDKPIGDGAICVDTVNMPAVPTPVSGPPTGIVVKILNREAATGGMTMLVTIPPGWCEDRAEHHDCIEESYKVSGDIWIVENHSPHTLRAGDYFFRPPRIKHGPMKTTHGTTSLIRFSAKVENHYGPIEPAA
jgi:quercetin dioxygenase-like cupin family protein